MTHRSHEQILYNHEIMRFPDSFEVSIMAWTNPLSKDVTGFFRPRPDSRPCSLRNLPAGLVLPAGCCTDAVSNYIDSEYGADNYGYRYTDFRNHT